YPGDEPDDDAREIDGHEDEEPEADARFGTVTQRRQDEREDELANADAGDRDGEQAEEARDREETRRVDERDVEMERDREEVSLHVVDHESEDGERDRDEQRFADVGAHRLEELREARFGLATREATERERAEA